MVSFKIQSKSKNKTSRLPAYDFCFHLIEAIEYQNWIHNTEFYRYELTPMSGAYRDTIPVGSVEFVHNHMNWFNIPIPKPINVPQELNYYEFTGREIFYDLSKIRDDKTYFIKSNSEVKSISGLIHGKDLIQKDKADLIIYPDWFPKKDLFISEYIETESEWRGFVHNHNLIDIKQYSGNPFIFPDITHITKMINTWVFSPIAYTIDIAILSNNTTVLIECHNFYSCGLYGFQDYRKLPIMFAQWWNEYLRKNKS